MIRTNPVRAAFDAGNTNGRVWVFCAIEGIDAAAARMAVNRHIAKRRIVRIIVQSPF